MVDYRALRMLTRADGIQTNDIWIYSLDGEAGSTLTAWTANAVTLTTDLKAIDVEDMALAAFTATDADGLPAHVNPADTATVISPSASLAIPAATVAQYVWEFWLFVPSDAMIRDTETSKEAGAFFMADNQGDLEKIAVWDGFYEYTEKTGSGMMADGRGVRIGKGLKRIRFYLSQISEAAGINLEISFDRGSTWGAINPDWIFVSKPSVTSQSVTIDPDGNIETQPGSAAVFLSNRVSLSPFNMDLGWSGHPDAQSVYSAALGRPARIPDLFVNPDTKSLEVVEDAHAVAFHVGQRIHTYWAEWYLDTGIGVQWLQEVMARNGSEGVQIAEALLRAEILATPGVRDINEIGIVWDHSLRRVRTTSLRIETDFDTEIDLNSPF